MKNVSVYYRIITSAQVEHFYGVQRCTFGKNCVSVQTKEGEFVSYPYRSIVHVREWES